jgi:DNA polymerase-3 subunit epsilon
MDSASRVDILAADARIAVIDFEGTGRVGRHPDEPWQIGMATLERGRVQPDGLYESLLRVGDRPFSPHTPGRYAERLSALRSAPTLHELWPTLRMRLAADALGAHRAATEKRYFRQAFPLHPFGPWVDTLTLARVAYPDLPSHQLDDVLDALDLKPRLKALAPGREAHDALYDAAGSALLLELLLAHRDWRGVTLSSLVSASARLFHQRLGARRARG